MSKFVEVKIIQSKVFLVEIEDSDEIGVATDLVCEEVFNEFDDLEAEILDSQSLIDSALRHTDKDKIFRI